MLKDDVYRGLVEWRGPDGASLGEILHAWWEPDDYPSREQTQKAARAAHDRLHEIADTIVARLEADNSGGFAPQPYGHMWKCRDDSI